MVSRLALHGETVPRSANVLDFVSTFKTEIVSFVRRFTIDNPVNNTVSGVVGTEELSRSPLFV